MSVPAPTMSRATIQTLLEARPEIAEALEMAAMERRFEMLDAMMDAIDAGHPEAGKETGLELIERMRQFQTGKTS